MAQFPSRKDLAMNVTVNGLSFHVVDEGSGPPVLLLHGFPDSSALWRHQIPALVDAGHRVIAPDLRGFGATDRPDGVAALRHADAGRRRPGILDTLGVQRADVVGHDWGAGIGWVLASVAPQRVQRYVALSVGHSADYFADIRQREMSWYMLLFLFEGVAEEALRRDDWALLRGWLRDAVDIERYVADLSRPGALTAALNYYRANIRPESFVGRSRADAAAGHLPRARRVVRRRHRVRRGPDAGLAGARDGAVALPPDRGRRALDPAGRPGRAERAAGRLPG